MSDFISLLVASLPNYLRDLETVVNADCGTYTKPGVDQVARLLRARAREFGAEVIDFPQTEYGDMLYARWRGAGRARIVMIGHTDTVYSEGKSNEFPFRRVAGRAHGCGVIDMKSGLLNGFYAMHALARAGFDRFAEIGIFCNSEEEIGSPVSRELYPQFVRGADAALILEPARESGAIVSARKGVGTYTVKVQGKPAHAGVEPEKGASAIYTLAQHITALKNLNGLRPGLTVNVGIIRGGTRANVVAETAEAVLDLRFPSVSDVAPFEQAAREIIAREIVPGTTSELIGGLDNPPMEKTDAIAHLVALAKHAGNQVGLQIEDVMTGGGSDGNYTASFGIPTLDGLGPQGGKAHNALEEFLIIDSIVPRAAMLANLIVAIANEK
ncbi:MAG: M20 family metallopeptidase [Chloroflexi bacterium]|nr:M20 family metallopeptidase [Chloroflexota bacterium]